MNGNPVNYGYYYSLGEQSCHTTRELTEQVRNLISQFSWTRVMMIPKEKEGEN